MKTAIKITRDKDFNCYYVGAEDFSASLSRQNWNYKNLRDCIWCKGPVHYWVTGYVNGEFMNLELHDYQDAKRLFLAMCKG